jgi:hypothetical protein
MPKQNAAHAMHVPRFVLPGAPLFLTPGHDVFPYNR